MTARAAAIAELLLDLATIREQLAEKIAEYADKPDTFIFYYEDGLALNFRTPRGSPFVCGVIHAKTFDRNDRNALAINARGVFNGNDQRALFAPYADALRAAMQSNLKVAAMFEEAA